MSADVPACVSEFIGTFLLVFTVGCNVLSGQAVWGGVSIGCVLMVAIYALAPISGANFNPAVSVALGLSKEKKWTDVGIYCAVQILAGIVASGCYSVLFWDSILLAPVHGYGWGNACICEFLYTLMLCLVVLNVTTKEAVNENGKQFYGLAIGFVIVAGAYGAGAVSGGCFNPAVAIGIDIGSLRVKWCVPYVIAELLGAAAAAGVFRLVRPAKFGGSGDIHGKEQKAKLVSEFLGTYFLVLTVGLNVQAKSPAAAFSIAASLMCMIFALGDVSGAHFNPAVTVAVLAVKKIDARNAGLFVIIQILAGAIAAFTYVVIFTGNGFALGPADEFGWKAVGFAEVSFTFVLCFVVLCVTSSSKNNLSEFSGLAIGSCVSVGGFAIGGISGGSMNPAVSFGIAFGDGGASIGEAMIYTIFEILGGVLAAIAFILTHEESFDTKDDA